MTRALLEDAATTLATAILDDPIGFDPTEDLVVPTTSDQAQRVVGAVLELATIAWRHHLTSQGANLIFNPVPWMTPRWVAYCTCQEHFTGGTKTEALRARDEHERKILELAVDAMVAEIS